MEGTNTKNLLDCKIVQIKRKNKIMGSALHYYHFVNSTNEIAADLAQKGEKEGTIVIAGIQKKGHGRLKRTWHSPYGGLWFSLVLRPEILPSHAPMITLMAGVALAKTIIETYNLDAAIKWPNDILIQGKKVCGILTEMRTSAVNINYVILGIGLNANFDPNELPEDIAKHSTTLSHEIKREIDLTELLMGILEEIEHYYLLLSSENSNEILKQWRKYSDTLGRKVGITTLQGTTLGEAVDVDDNGALLIKTGENVIQKFLAGDCMHLANSGRNE